jgi:hypothetical protein
LLHESWLEDKAVSGVTIALPFINQRFFVAKRKKRKKRRKRQNISGATVSVVQLLQNEEKKVHTFQ